MILKGSSCIPAISLCIQLALHGRAKTVAAVIVHTQIQFFKSSILNLKVVSGFRALVTSSWHLVRVTQPDNYWLGMLNWSHVTWLTLLRTIGRLQLRRVPELKLLDWTWTGQELPADSDAESSSLPALLPVVTVANVSNIATTLSNTRSSLHLGCSEG